MPTYSQHENGLQAWIRRYPWLFLSLLIHGIIIFIIANHTSEALKIQQHKQYEQQKERVGASMQKARQVEMAQRAENIDKIKSLMEKSVQSAISKPDAEKSPNKKEASKKSPEELLADAQKTVVELKKLADAARVEELSRVLNIPKEEALERVNKENLKKEIQQQSAREQQKNKSNSSPEEPAKSIQKLEQEAHAILNQRQNQLDKMNVGGGQMDGGGRNRNSLQADSGAGQALEAINVFLSKSSYEMPKSSFVTIDFIPTAKGTAHKKAGRVIGAGGEYAERIYLNSWYLIGPFVGLPGEDLYKNPSYPPEQLIDLDAEYFGKDGKVLTWQYFNSKRYPLIPPGPAEDAVYYGYTEIKIDKATDLWLWVGADDDIKIWLNDNLVWVGGYSKQWFFDEIYAHRQHYISQWNLSEDKIRIHLNTGRNKILFKLSNGPNAAAIHGYFASLVLTK
ncbi:MAG: hypothetical protein B0W54_24075 [Cellvibrio sp. 79]|nr:MAG: hypothetical protein B0W54_24075 [Cellvibrio sp. 79]